LLKGIGPARQRWLRETLNVRTYRDLADLSIDELESRLKDVGQIPSRSDIARWIAQAQELAAAAELAPESELGPVKPEDSGEGARPAGMEAEWMPFASFVVEFQSRNVEGRVAEHRTTAHHMETHADADWPGLESVKLSQWMLEQIRDKVLSTEEELFEPIPPAVAPPPARPSLVIEIAQVRVFQPPDAKEPTGIGEAGQPFSGFIKSDQPFALEASIKIYKPIGVDASTIGVTYRAQFYGRNLSTGKTLSLGNTEPGTIVEDKLDYIVVLTNAILPQGMYRLQALVTLQGVLAVPGLLEVPFIQVV
jgi:hypothetical protein